MTTASEESDSICGRPTNQSNFWAAEPSHPCQNYPGSDPKVRGCRFHRTEEEEAYVKERERRILEEGERRRAALAPEPSEADAKLLAAYAKRQARKRR